MQGRVWFWFFAVLEIEPRALHLLCGFEPHLSPSRKVFVMLLEVKDCQMSGI
jgi:hypothetical protein